MSAPIDRAPDTPLLRYFRGALYTGEKGTSWGDKRVAEANRLLDDPGQLAEDFTESARTVEAEYRNYQPFYPDYHRFGSSKGMEHGAYLGATVDVAARLAKREVWDVPDHPHLAFRYLDREILIGRSKPAPRNPIRGAALLVDLFLANARDRTPILCELKLRTDQCALYALVQVLTQAAYATTTSQRERLVLFGSTPDFVLKEAVQGKPATIDLYVLLVEKPDDSPHSEIYPLARKLSRKLIADSRIRSRIRRIAWIEAKDDGRRGLTIAASHVATSRLSGPKTHAPSSSISSEPFYIDAGDNADWTKQTLDFFVPNGKGGRRRVASVADMHTSLQASGMSVQDFKQLPAFRLALRNQPWLRDL